MADYRLSAKTISRGKGQSVVASAAYRSGERLMDDRTGQVHDYSRRGGVLHAEIVAPDNTPDWMHDRAQLWNSVEAVERRKDAQLAREIQLSLPHELEHEQRLELVRDFVQEQFVNHGMIADIAIHAPDANGDARNHHAHIMLTMRDLTGDGFGKKNRDWNSPDLLSTWREQWAMHQNRQLERHGHPDRVDHRSYADQGIDREPTQHLGPTANDMERNGKESRIGDENRERLERNKLRAQWYAAEFALELEIARRHTKFERWKTYSEQEIKHAQELAHLDLDQKHSLRRERLEDQLTADYGTAKATVRAELAAIDQRMQAKGLRKMVRNVLGRTRQDEEHRTNMQRTLKGIEQRENEQRNKLERQNKLEKQKLSERQAARASRAKRSIEHRQEQLRKKAYMARKEHLQSAPSFERKNKKRKLDDIAPKRTIETEKPVRDRFTAANENSPRESAREDRTEGAASSSGSSGRTPTIEPVEPSERLSLDDRKRISDVHINEGDRNKLKKPFERTSLKQLRAKGSKRKEDKPKPDRSPKNER